MSLTNSPCGKSLIVGGKKRYRLDMFQSCVSISHSEDPLTGTCNSDREVKNTQLTDENNIKYRFFPPSYLFGHNSSRLVASHVPFRSIAGTYSWHMSPPRAVWPVTYSSLKAFKAYKTYKIGRSNWKQWCADSAARCLMATNPL